MEPVYLVEIRMPGSEVSNVYKMLEKRRSDVLEFQDLGFDTMLVSCWPRLHQGRPFPCWSSMAGS